MRTATSTVTVEMAVLIAPRLRFGLANLKRFQFVSINFSLALEAQTKRGFDYGCLFSPRMIGLTFEWQSKIHEPASSPPAETTCLFTYRTWTVDYTLTSDLWINGLGQ